MNVMGIYQPGRMAKRLMTQGNGGQESDVRLNWGDYMKSEVRGVESSMDGSWGSQVATLPSKKWHFLLRRN